ncbi:hypothetical protein FHS83_003219 [Rhizomicrobium palustre]|uniref:Beta-lactamase-related domain-containing protein n=1 Tax=Rhizomicrobium palustre TaxID=189966 RepID=A0A846N3T6_9PROT|nr:serine hydrolase [Rhizomicrobium palustre]NIK89901.1 hypothetical protein [Rhizomicrobium palustre]
MRWLAIAAFLFVAPCAAGYLPPPGDDWAKHAPAREGFDVAKLQAAIDFAKAHEYKLSPELDGVIDQRDLRLIQPLQYAGEPFNTPIGPLAPHAPLSGIILRHGYIVAEWGDTAAADMTNSISKTFLSAVAGVAFDRHMIPDVHAPVIDLVQPSPDFLLPHNRSITWDMMLRQTSGWIGTMWGKPWWADRPGKQAWDELAKGPPEPGKEWKYSDVRVNALALALTHVWKRPLPDVLSETVMEPIGASKTWHWEGYENSYTQIGGKRVKVVSGGGHWGGGMFISGRDLARLGLLALNKGAWGKKRILSEQWIAMARTPTGPNPGYGYMNWFLNTDGRTYPAAPKDSVTFIGNGTNMVYVDYQHDLVAVVRWIDDKQRPEFVRLLNEAIAR